MGALWGLLVLAGLHSSSARATDATLWISPGVDPTRAAEAATLLGHTDVAIRPVGELARAVQVVGVVDRQVEDLCGGPVDASEWVARLAAGRQQLQFLDLQGALSSFSMLEAQLPCLTGLLSPGDVFRFHLSATEVDLTAARSQPTGSELKDFYRREATAAARRAAASAPYGQPPVDTLVEARQLLVSVRAQQVGQSPARVVVAGPPDRVWWDGSRASQVAFDVPAGSHIFQLTDGSGRVVAVKVAELRPGDAAVVWARPDATPLRTEDVQAAAQTLAQTGRAPIGLAQSLRALSLDGPSYVVTGDDDGVVLWGADGDMVRLKLADPPRQAGSSSAGAGRASGNGTPAGADSHSVDGAFVLGPRLGVDGPDGSMLLGLVVGARLGVAPVLVLSLALDADARDLPGSAAWPASGQVSVAAGPRYRLPSRLWDLGLQVAVVVPVGSAAQSTSPAASVAAVSSLRLPAASLGGLRIEAQGGWQPGGWLTGVALLLDLGG